MSTITWDPNDPTSLPSIDITNADLQEWSVVNAKRLRCYRSGLWVKGPGHLVREPRTGAPVLPEYSNGDRSIPGFGRKRA